MEETVAKGAMEVVEMAKEGLETATAEVAKAEAAGAMVKQAEVEGAAVVGTAAVVVRERAAARVGRAGKVSLAGRKSK